MDTLREYSKHVWFMFTRINAQIIRVSIHRNRDTLHIRYDIQKQIFNDLGIETDRNYILISYEAADSLAGLLTTLGIKVRRTIGNPPHETTNTVSQC